MIAHVMPNHNIRRPQAPCGFILLDLLDLLDLLVASQS
jgi:hypothetical protein